MIKLDYKSLEKFVMLELPIDFAERMKALLGDEYDTFVTRKA